MAAINLARVAFEAPEAGQQPRPSGGRPVDLVHLARQTGGDKDLETEVLTMFARQARQAVASYAGLGAAEQSALAHKIAGSAKSVGAFDVARHAASLEEKPANAAALASFTKAVIDADTFIVSLIR